jgi:hypothetical protein
MHRRKAPPVRAGQGWRSLQDGRIPHGAEPCTEVARKANLALRHDGETDELESAIEAASSALEAALEEIRV